MVSYTALNVPDPVAVGVDATGVGWSFMAGSHLIRISSLMVKLGAVAGLGSVMLVMLLGQSRVFFSMAHDGLLPKWAGKIHPRFRTPYISTIFVGIFVAFFAAVIPISILGELVSIGTLLAFVIVCAGVWVLRKRRPDLAPAVPHADGAARTNSRHPGVGRIDGQLAGQYMASSDCVAGTRHDHLLRLRPFAQPRRKS